MVQHRTMLNVADNTGAKILMVIQIYGGSIHRKGELGSYLGCVVKKACLATAIISELPFITKL